MLWNESIWRRSSQYSSNCKWHQCKTISPYSMTKHTTIACLAHSCHKKQVHENRHIGVLFAARSSGTSTSQKWEKCHIGVLCWERDDNRADIKSAFDFGSSWWRRQTRLVWYQNPPQSLERNPSARSVIRYAPTSNQQSSVIGCEYSTSSSMAQSPYRQWKILIWLVQSKPMYQIPRQLSKYQKPYPFHNVGYSGVLS